MELEGPGQKVCSFFWGCTMNQISKFKDNTGRLSTMQCKERGGTEREMDCFGQSLPREYKCKSSHFSILALTAHYPHYPHQLCT